MARDKDEESLSSDDSAFNEYTSKEDRLLFIRKVYMILFGLLGFTAGVIALFLFEPHCNWFALEYYWVFIICLLVSLIFYMVLTCSVKARRSFPCNVILLCIYTVISAFGFAILSASYAPILVLYAFAITAAVCLFVTFLAMQKCIDITGWGVYLCIASMVLSLFGLIAMLFIFVLGWSDTMKIVYLVLGALMALMCCMYFMFVTQLIIGGKKYSLSPKDYILGVITLYSEVMTLFMIILSMLGLVSR